MNDFRMIKALRVCCFVSNVWHKELAKAERDSVYKNVA